MRILKYAVVRAGSYVPDRDRVITEHPRTIAVSDDLSESNLLAFVIEDYECWRLRHGRREHEDARVFYQVLDRVSISADYRRDQVAALRQIRDLLEPGSRPPEGPSGPEASPRAVARSDDVPGLGPPEYRQMPSVSAPAASASGAARQAKAKRQEPVKPRPPGARRWSGKKKPRPKGGAP